MKYKRALFLLAAIGVLAATASAATITYDIQAYIDGRSLLIFQGDTLQWHNTDYTVPGKHAGNDPTYITTTLDSVTVMNNYQWFPDWPGGTNGNKWSSVMTGLDPDFPGAEILSVGLDVVSARSILKISQLPDAGNGYTLILEFDDNGPGGADWYRGKVTITTLGGGSPIPEPGAGLLAAAGLLLVLARRRFA